MRERPEVIAQRLLDRPPRLRLLPSLEQAVDLLARRRRRRHAQGELPARGRETVGRISDQLVELELPHEDVVDERPQLRLEFNPLHPEDCDLSAKLDRALSSQGLTHLPKIRSCKTGAIAESEPIFF